MSTGLRERKKSATRQALHEAAVRLAIEHGLERVTVEAIADAAEVSRRTFSNYFASKEEALLHGDLARMRQLLDVVRSRPASEAPWPVLTAAAVEVFQELGTRDPRWIAQVRLVRRHPALAAQQVTTYTSMEDDLTAELSARGVGAPLRARLMAAAFLTSLRVAVQAFPDRTGDTPLVDVMREALAETGEGFLGGGA
ncbi:TetR family transcriptional regulator [Dactylosporangium aurantiacum]|uniref:TetR family transcriptional regulator n=1 Tax=Dactylosporangium aurantiacum TaxID=35754 RepID=A0A9Q9MPS5_9ACTN|nr:TetR/AcrR family transcriptional regulator [Dactylosporangium aurantiacum]MDG6104093.1 helix-turn-helix domain containing protein [Dactylosporangium aurantiacum]UWZ56892.1 TetR family transcriptional regulator [Dactylosporangium aurantiacum]